MDFKVIFSNEYDLLQKLNDNDADREKRISNLETLVGELNQRLSNVETVELTQLRESLEQKQKELEGMVDTIKKVVNEEMGFEEKMKALQDIKDMLPEVERKADSVAPTLEEQKTVIEKQKAEVVDLKRLTGKFDEDLREMQREWKGAERSVTGAEKRLKEIEAKCEEVRETQERLEKNVNSRYADLWKDVVVEIKDQKNASIGELKKEIAKKNDASNNRASSLVNYALQVMSKAAEVAKCTAVKKDFIDLWREKADDRLRTKLGCRTLDAFWNRRWRGRDAFRHWKDRASEETKILRLAKEYENKIPDAPRIVGILEDTGLPEQVQDLWTKMRELRDNKANETDVLDKLQKSSEEVDTRFKKVAEIEIKMGSQGADIQRLVGDLKEVDVTTKGLDQQVRIDTHEIQRIDAGLSDFAKANEVSGMMKDVLLIWNSIKQLDAAKADKTEVDAMALEGLNKEKMSSRRLEDIEAEGSAKLSEGVMMMHERWQDLHGRVDDNSKQLQTLQQMLGPLASFVEELVAKIAETQGVDTMRLPPGGIGGGRPPPRESWVSSPSPDGKDPGGANGGNGSGAVAVESMEQWLNGAKGIVEATLGGGPGPPAASAGGAERKYPPRPGSARGPPRSAATGDLGIAPTMVTGQRVGTGQGMERTLPSMPHAAGHWAVGQRHGGVAGGSIRRSGSLQARR